MDAPRHLITSRSAQGASRRVGGIRQCAVRVCFILFPVWVLSGCAGEPERVAAPVATVAPPVAFPWPSVVSAPLPPPTAVPVQPEPTEPPPSLGRCGQWSAVAVTAGLDIQMLDRWGDILWRESRCDPAAHNATDPNGGSYGLAQVNGFWCRPSRYFPDGWLQARGVLLSCVDLFDPAINLTAAAEIFAYSVERNGCGWLPWTTRSTRWCL